MAKCDAKTDHKRPKLEKHTNTPAGLVKVCVQASAVHWFKCVSVSKLHSFHQIENESATTTARPVNFAAVVNWASGRTAVASNCHCGAIEDIAGALSLFTGVQCQCKSGKLAVESSSLWYVYIPPEYFFFRKRTTKSALSEIIFFCISSASPAAVLSCQSVPHRHFCCTTKEKGSQKIERRLKEKSTQ